MQHGRKGLSVPEIDLRLRRRRERGVKPNLYDSRLIQRRERILCDDWEAAFREDKARTLAERAALQEAATDEKVSAFLEAAGALLEVAPRVSAEDVEGIGQVIESLASWFPSPGPEEGKVVTFRGAEI